MNSFQNVSVLVFNVNFFHLFWVFNDTDFWINLSVLLLDEFKGVLLPFFPQSGFQSIEFLLMS